MIRIFDEFVHGLFPWIVLLGVYMEMANKDYPCWPFCCGLWVVGCCYAWTNMVIDEPMISMNFSIFSGSPSQRATMRSRMSEENVFFGVATMIDWSEARWPFSCSLRSVVARSFSRATMHFWFSRTLGLNLNSVLVSISSSASLTPRSSPSLSI